MNGYHSQQQHPPEPQQQFTRQMQEYYENQQMRQGRFTGQRSQSYQHELPPPPYNHPHQYAGPVGRDLRASSDSPQPGLRCVSLSTVSQLTSNV